MPTNRAAIVQWSGPSLNGPEFRGLFSGYRCAAFETLASIAASALRAFHESST